MATFLEGILQGSVIWNRILAKVQRNFTIFFRILDVVLVATYFYVVFTKNLGWVEVTYLTIGLVALIFIMTLLNTLLNMSCSSLLVKYNISMSMESDKIFNKDSMILRFLTLSNLGEEDRLTLYKQLESDLGKFIGKKILLQYGEVPPERD